MDSTMIERPILFNAEMVNAILAGNKTQTRRVMKDWQQPQPCDEFGFTAIAQKHAQYGFCVHGKSAKECANQLVESGVCPLGRVGGRIWVREAWATDDSLDNKPPRDFSAWPVRYLADGKKRSCGAFTGNTAGKNRRSMHMPRWASRITLEITAVRVERLRDISEEDADAEGCERLDSGRDERDFKLCPKCGGTGLHLSLGGGGGVCEDDCNECNTYKKRYQHLWSSIYGAESWDANPWTWVIEFKRITP